MSWPDTPYDRLCCIASTLEVLADAVDDDGSNTSNVLRLLVRELDLVKSEVCEAEARAERQERVAALAAAPADKEETP